MEVMVCVSLLKLVFLFVLFFEHALEDLTAGLTHFKIIINYDLDERHHANDSAIW
jgi:hypothetical protein